MKEKYTEEYIAKIVNDNNFKLLDIFKKSNKLYVKVECKRGHISEKRIESDKIASCKHCKTKPISEVKSIIEKEGYKLLSTEFLGYKQKLNLICPKGHYTEMQFGNFINGKRCKYCANNVSHKYEYIKLEVEKSGYKLLSNKYINGYEKLELKCDKGHIYHAPYNSFRQGHRCPICKNRSLGEQEIENYLISKNILFKTQHCFKDCRDKKEMPFDFYLPKYNCIIEYDGRHHFEIVEDFGGEENYKITKRHDNLKKEYCNKNNISLLRIPYWDFNNIEDIIEEYLSFVI